MPNYKYTPEAQDEIKNILDHTIKNWGKAQANKYIDGLEKLAENPNFWEKGVMPCTKVY